MNETITSTWLITTDEPSNSTKLPAYSGFLFLLGSSFFYGSNFLPVKQYETGDGMFFQLILCIGIWTVSLIVNSFRNFPKFYPLPLLGGFIWATGNITTVPIIQSIGIGLGILIWGGVSLFTGWATARFGLFGLNAEIPSKVALNYVAVALILVSTIFYLFVNTETKRKPNETSPITEDSANINESDLSKNDSTNDLLSNSNENLSYFERMPASRKRLVGIGLSIFAGICYGQSATPILYIRANYPSASTNNMDYIFSNYTGILITSVFYFAIYCMFKKNKPNLYPQIILPGLVSGWMWGIANIFYFLSLNAISQSVSFPIANSGPPIFSNIWGIFLYKEIKGKKNFILLLGGFAFAITGSILCGLSF